MALALKLPSWGSNNSLSAVRGNPNPQVRKMSPKTQEYLSVHFGVKWTFHREYLERTRMEVLLRCGANPGEPAVFGSSIGCSAGSLEITYDGARHGGKEELTLRASAVGSLFAVLRK